jgi:hypothetical protein
MDATLGMLMRLAGFRLGRLDTRIARPNAPIDVVPRQRISTRDSYISHGWQEREQVEEEGQ